MFLDHPRGFRDAERVAERRAMLRSTADVQPLVAWCDGLRARRGVRAVIPRRRDQRPGDRRHRPFDRAVYRERNRVERLINRLKQYRRVATGYEKRAGHYAAMLTIAAALLWLPRFAHAPKETVWEC